MFNRQVVFNDVELSGVEGLKGLGSFKQYDNTSDIIINAKINGQVADFTGYTVYATYKVNEVGFGDVVTIQAPNGEPIQDLGRSTKTGQITISVNPIVIRYQGTIQLELIIVNDLDKSRFTSPTLSFDIIPSLESGVNTTPSGGNGGGGSGVTPEQSALINKIPTIESNIGDKATLTTTNKTDLVKAINEVNAKEIPQVDLTNYVQKEEGKSLISDIEINQISENKNEIEILKSNKGDVFYSNWGELTNPSNESITDLSALCGYNSTTWGDKVVFFGHQLITNDPSNMQFPIYDSVNGSMKLIFPFIGEIQCRSGVVIGDDLYLLGGVDSRGNEVDRNLKLNLKNESTKTNLNIPKKLNMFEPVLHDGKIYIIGGRVYSSSGVVMSSNTYEYDPIENTYKTMTNIPIEISSYTAKSYDGHIYVIGGIGKGSDVGNNVHRFNPSTNTWTRLSNLPFSFREPTSFVWNNELYVVAGYSASINSETGAEYLNTTKYYKYNKKSDTWEYQGDFDITSSGTRSTQSVSATKLGVYATNSDYKSKRSYYYKLFPKSNGKLSVSQKQGTSDLISEYVGVKSELVINTTDHSIHVMDGVKKGGYKISVDSVVKRERELEDLRLRIDVLESLIK